MFNPITAFWNWLWKPETPPKQEMRRETEPILSCNEITLARQAMSYLGKQGYLYVKDARVDRVGNHCYLVFPSNEDPENSEVEIELY